MNQIDFIKLDSIFPKWYILKFLFKKHLKKQIYLYLLSFIFVALIIMYSISYNKVALIASVSCLIIYILLVSIHLSYKIYLEYKASKKIKVERNMLVTDLYIDIILKTKKKENVIRVTYDKLTIKEQKDNLIFLFDKSKIIFKKCLMKEQTLNYIKEKLEVCM